MKYTNLYNLNFSQIISFLYAAKYENFSLAAKHLHVSQPMVSHNITSLEVELGINLFHRDGKKITLTEAGRTLSDSLGGIVQHLENAISEAQKTHEKLNTSISICDDRGSDKNLYFYPIIRNFQHAFPNVTLNFEQTDASWAINSIYNGSCDIAFLMKHELSNIDEKVIDYKLVFEMTWGAFVNKTNPLFEKTSLSLKDLEGEPLTLLSAQASSSYTNTVISMLNENGVDINVNSYASNNTSLAFSMYTGDAIVLANELLLVPDKSKVRFFPLKGTSDGLALIWKKNYANPLIPNFIKITEDFFKNEYHPS